MQDNNDNIGKYFMTLSDFRAEYPEYADLPDSEVMCLIEPPEEEEDAAICAPGIEAELSGIAEQLKKITAHISKKEKPEKEDAALLAMGLQLQIIAEAIKAHKPIEMKPPVINIPATRDIEYMDVKRDEFNYITRLVPKYK